MLKFVFSISLISLSCCRITIPHDAALPARIGLVALEIKPSQRKILDSIMSVKPEYSRMTYVMQNYIDFILAAGAQAVPLPIIDPIEHLLA